MADAVSFAGSRVSSFPRARITWNFHLALDLVAPAVLLGLLRLWSTSIAPRHGVYFTAEALLIVYAYFAVVRGVSINARSYDGAEVYDRARALRAKQDFFRELGRHGVKIALVVLPLLLAALALDVLTADSGLQYRLNVHLSILFVEVMVWARYGAAVVVTAARWSPPRPPAFAVARELASSLPVAGIFALTNVGFGIVAVAVVVASTWGSGLLPSAMLSNRASFLVSVGLFTGLAWLALWLQCRWSLRVLPQLEAQR